MLPLRPYHLRKTVMIWQNSSQAWHRKAWFTGHQSTLGTQGTQLTFLILICKMGLISLILQDHRDEPTKRYLRKLLEHAVQGLGIITLRGQVLPSLPQGHAQLGATSSECPISCSLSKQSLLLLSATAGRTKPGSRATAGPFTKGHGTEASCTDQKQG